MDAVREIDAIPGSKFAASKDAGNSARLVIGNLLNSTGGTLDAASELARLTGHGDMAQQIDELRSYLARLAAKADGISHRELDWVSLGMAMHGPITRETFAAASRSPAFQFYLERRIRQALPEVGPSEANLLLCLLEQAGTTVTKTALHMLIKSRAPNPDVVKVYVSRLRKALGRIGLDQAIESSRAGYCLRDDCVVPLVDALRAE